MYLKNNLQFMILYTCDLQIRSRSSNWYELLDPNQGYNHAKFERPPLNSVHQKAKCLSFCQIRKHVNYLPWICAKVENSGILISILDLLNNPTKFWLNQIQFSVKTVWPCCDLEIWWMSLKVVWTGKAQWVVSSCKVWHLSH